MRFSETKLPGAYVITYEPIEDERGFFARSFCQEEFKAHGIHDHFVQCNLSFNHKKGTVRGLHYQKQPYEEAKVVSCRRGAIFDVIVDLRKESMTYGEWVAVELSAASQQALYVPPGLAHGFQTLSDDSEVFYLMGHYFHPEAASGIRWNDQSLAITWPLEVSVIATKDCAWPELA